MLTPGDSKLDAIPRASRRPGGARASTAAALFLGGLAVAWAVPPAAPRAAAPRAAAVANVANVADAGTPPATDPLPAPPPPRHEATPGESARLEALAQRIAVKKSLTEEQAYYAYRPLTKRQWQVVLRDISEIRTPEAAELLGWALGDATPRAFFRQAVDQLAAMSPDDAAGPPGRFAVLRLVGGNDLGQKTAQDALKQATRSLVFQVLEALGENGTRQAENHLLKACDSPNWAYAASAIEALGALPDPSPAVPKKLLFCLRSDQLQRRTTAAGALGRLRAKEAAGPLVELLDNANWHIRSAVIEALTALREAKAVPALIERVDKESGRLRAEVVSSLVSLTGQKLGGDGAAWKKWWKDHKEGFQVAEETGPAPPEEEHKTTYYGVPIVTKQVCFVLDISGSMDTRDAGGASDPKNPAAGKNRLDVAKRELLDALERLGKEVAFNIIFFDDRMEPMQKRLEPATPEHKKKAKAFVERQRPRGETNIFDALELALDDPDVDTVFLLSDGSPSAGRLTDPEDILGELRAMNRGRRVVLHAIAVGERSSFLEALARQNGGTYVQK
ncbi:MAG: HEAT repeat domain-containing protein [Planctomycetes bacterium]|nr:HEAT repeat domain-containing protein [Planctomycetota bacterium]